jgi:hypothetical protein
MKNTRESGSPTASHPGGNNQWEGWDFAKQDTGGGPAVHGMPASQQQGGGNFDQWGDGGNQYYANQTRDANARIAGLAQRNNTSVEHEQTLHDANYPNSWGAQQRLQTGRGESNSDMAMRMAGPNSQYRNAGGGRNSDYRPPTGNPGGGLSGLSSQASGGGGMQSMSMAPQSMPSAPGMSSMMAKPNMKRKAKGGLGALANQASGMGMMQKPNLTYG